MYRNLFVPVDGSVLSERAMQASIDLARQLGAAITGFVVEPDAPMPTDTMPMQNYALAARRHVDRTDEHARAVLTRFEVKASEAGVVFTGLHAHSDGVDRAIVEQAETSGCDMIVMGARGTSALRSAMLGSVSNEVLHASAMPVVIVKATDPLVEEV